MKSASTVQRTNDLIDSYNSKRTKPIAKVEYYNGTQWIALDDVNSFSFSRSAQNRDPARFSLIPTPQTLNLQLDNRRGIYSPDTAGEFSNVLRRNLPLRASIGYAFNSDDSPISVYSHALASYSEIFHTQIIGSKLHNLISASAFGEINGIPFTLYDELNYDDGVYAAEGYYKSEILDFGAFDIETLLTIRATADTNKIKVYYRSSGLRDQLENGDIPFTYLSDTAAGTFDIDIPPAASADRYFQFAIVFATGRWYSGVDQDYITAISIRYTVDGEFFTLGEFLTDNVDFGSSIGGKNVSVSARDKLKKALESDVSTWEYESADVSQIIRDICDKMEIPHNDGTEYIPNSGYDVSFAGTSEEKGIDLLQEAVFYLNAKNSNYRLYVNDAGYLQLTNEAKPNTNYDFIFNYNDHLFDLSRSISTDNILQRITIFSSDENTKTGISEILASEVYTTAGVKTITWGADHLKKSYKFIITTGGFNYISMDNESITFEITGSTPSVAVTVYGDAVNESYTGFSGEAVKAAYIEEGEGYTQTIINRFIQSDAEAGEIAEALISRFSDDETALQGSIAIDGFPLMEINDLILVLEINTNTFQLYVIEGISISYDAEGARYKQNLQIRSIGNTLSDIVYDRNLQMHGIYGGVDDLVYDRGLLYDMHFFGEEIDPNTYHKKVRFTAV